MHRHPKVEQQVVVALRRITRAMDLHSRLLLQRYGLTAPQLAALRVIERMQPMSAGTLARELRLSQGTVSGILQRLEKRALIDRTRGVQDRRSVKLELTDAGAKVVAEAPSLLDERFRRALSRLAPWERTTILATLQRIAAMVDAEGMEAEPALRGDIAEPGEGERSPPLEDAFVLGDHASLADEASPAVGGPAWEGSSSGTAIRPRDSEV